VGSSAETTPIASASIGAASTKVKDLATDPSHISLSASPPPNSAPLDLGVLTFLSSAFSTVASVPMDVKVIKLEGLSEGGVGSARTHQVPHQLASATNSDVDPAVISTSTANLNSPIKSPPSSHFCRDVVSSPWLDHVSVITLGIRSLWHVGRRARDLGGLYQYDMDMMLETSVSEYLDSMGVLLGRCLAMIQHFRVAVERQADL